ncbi:MAG: hypothetical protein GY754_28360 [bacterium]|nr:hypothetical protein [bacterium]
MAKNKNKKKQKGVEARGSQWMVHEHDRRKEYARNAAMREAFSRPKEISGEMIDLLFQQRYTHLSPAVKERFNSLIPLLEDCYEHARKLRLKNLLKFLANNAPKLIDERYLGAYWMLASVQWSGELKTWQAKGRSIETQFRSLVDYLLVKFPVPRFFYSLFFLEPGDTTDKLIKFFKYAAEGGSVYKAVSSGIIPVPLTRRMCHQFLRSPGKMEFFEALRFAQVKAFQGEHSLAQAITATRLGRSFMNDEPFWLTVIQWFCNNPDIDRAMAGPLIDYFRHCKEENSAFSVTGRTVSAMTRGMEEWHRELALIKKLRSTFFTPSGFEEKSWEFKRRTKEGNFLVTSWSMVEILTSKDLAAEGRSMGHCVFSYASHISSGSTAIWSLKKNSERVLTIEVNIRSKKIVQARGKHNRWPSDKELLMLKRWASENYCSVQI